MKCFKCEKEIQGQVKYCPRCGTYLGFSDELIQRAIQGDEAAQAELYNRTYSDVYFTILSITKDKDLIMDMVQDTYLTAFRKLEQLKDSDSFCAWLKRIAHNRTLNALRDRRVLHTATTISTETEVVLEIEDDRIESLPEASMDQKETSRLVREILDALPEDQRIVVGMYYYDQLSVSEIAEELECSENTVKSRLNYGRKKIQGKVLELEKKGTKLYNLAPLPFFIWLLRNLYKQPDEKMFQVIRQKIACDNILNAKESSNPDKDISDKNGDGKGKTTTAMGLCTRAAGYGYKVLIYQFMKNNKTSERKILQQIPNITFVDGLEQEKFSFQMTISEKLERKTYYEKQFRKITAKAAEENYDLLFFDELIYTIRAGLFDEQILLDYLKNEKPAHLEVILTGQQPSEELVALADYVSEIRKIKHPFDQGLPARLGIEK